MKRLLIQQSVLVADIEASDQINEATLLRSEDPKRLLFTISSTNVHPTRLAGFSIGGCHLVIDRGNASSTKGVQVTQGTLIMTWSLRNLLLSYSCGHSRCKNEQKQESQLHIKLV